MKKYILLLIFLFIYTGVFAQQTEEHKMKAAYLYHFTKYIEWPANKRTGDFVICIFGDRLTYRNLIEKIKTKKVGSFDNIKIVYVDEFDEIPNCHIIFVGENFKSELESISLKARKQNSLLVTDAYAGCKSGAAIEFVFNKDHLGFKINISQMELSKLSVSSQLIGMAIK